MNISLNTSKDKWVENFARFGFAAKGVTYILIGILSAITAYKGGSKGLDKQGAVKEIWEHSYGNVFLVLLTLGFLSYMIWRFVLAVKDPENKGTSAGGLFKRFTYLISGLLYGSLAFYCIKILLHSSNKNSGNKAFMEKLLDHTGGQILIGALGLFILGFGLYQCYQAYSNNFRKEVNDLGVNDKIRKAYNIYGKIGYISRGIVLILMGFFMLKATVNSNANQAEGSDGILSFLFQIGGPYLMGAIALGLAGYGVFMLVKARYQTVKV